MSKNKNITDKSSIPIPRLKSFDPTITRNNIISKQQFFSTTISDEQQELGSCIQFVDEPLNIVLSLNKCSDNFVMHCSRF